MPAGTRLVGLPTVSAARLNDSHDYIPLLRRTGVRPDRPSPHRPRRHPARGRLSRSVLAAAAKPVAVLPVRRSHSVARRGSDRRRAGMARRGSRPESARRDRPGDRRGGADGLCGGRADQARRRNDRRERPLLVPCPARVCPGARRKHPAVVPRGPGGVRQLVLDEAASTESPRS
jgi:hypothetical protein